MEGLGANPSALDAIAYSIAVLSVSGILFGVIWARTKNLFALMLIHAAGDLLPEFRELCSSLAAVKGLRCEARRALSEVRLNESDS